MNTSRNPVTTICLICFFGAATLLTVVGFLARSWLPPVASQHGLLVDTLIYYLLVTTGVVFVIGHVALGWLVWKHTRGGPATYKPVSPRTELLWALVPVGVMAVVSEVGVLVLGLPVWKELYAETSDPIVEIEVVGKQFEWMVRYPGKDKKFGRTLVKHIHATRNPMGLVEEDTPATDDVVVNGVLRIPVNRTIQIRLRSQDVQHAFNVPAFRVKQDLVPGMTTQTRFKAIQTGEFDLACAELCGLGHYKMQGKVIVLTQEDYDKWLAQQVGWFE